MTVSPDARTPSTPVHALSGSSAGPGRPFAPVATVHELPDPFVPLGNAAAGVVKGLAARRSGPDAEIIDLAGRVKRLAAREQSLCDRTAGIEDAAHLAMPPRPQRAEGEICMTSETTVEPSGTRVITIREPAGWEAENRANREAHEAALAAWEQRLAAEQMRRRLPWWTKLRERASVRLSRWGLRLARMEALTVAGVVAKAAASVAVSEGGSLLDPWRQQLAASLSRDALRLIEAQAEANEREHEARDRDLFPHGRRWQDAEQEHRAAEAEMEASWHRYLAIAPADPEELFVSERDHRRVAPYVRPHIKGRMWYGDDETLLMLREGYPKDLGDERRAEILTTHDRWIAEHAAARHEARCDVCEAAETAASARENEARLALFLTPARTLDGLMLKARAALTIWGGAEYGIEGIERKLKAACKDGDAADEAAMAVLLDLARLSMTRSVPEPVPLDHIEFPAGRYPVGTPREVVETYRTFLELELSYLNHEVYGQHAGRMHYWHDNPAARLHHPGGPAASSRATAVLDLLGLMPVAGRDGRAQAAASAA